MPKHAQYISRSQLADLVLFARQAKHDMQDPCASHGLRVAARGAYATAIERITVELANGARHRKHAYAKQFIKSYSLA